MATSNKSKSTSKHVLIVDDEEFTRDIYKDAFESEGYEVTEASSGTEAFNKMKDESFDGIILDVMMPDMDGVTVLSKMVDEDKLKDQGKIMIATNLEPNSIVSLQKLYDEHGGDPTALNVVEHIVKVKIEPLELVEMMESYM